MFSLRPVSHWTYPASDPAPPTPHVVLGAPVDTPPPDLPQPRTAPTFDRDAPCPATPYCVPSGLPEVGTTGNPSSCSTTLTYPSSGEIRGGFTDQDQNQPRSPMNLCYTLGTYQWPSPVVAMVQRAFLDSNGSSGYTQPVNLSACPWPTALFTFTGGLIPRTGNNEIDFQTLQYYAPQPCISSLVGPNFDTYPISCIEAVQRSLNLDWSRVYPKPIPPVIVRSRDLVGDYDLRQLANGHAFIVPAGDSIWTVVCQRGINSKYRPINAPPDLTGALLMGRARYDPQHIMASEFAVNVFLEVGDSASGQNSRCKYLGAYILQEVDDTTISPVDWARIDPRERRTIFERVPERFTVRRPGHPLSGWPLLPSVRFLYYEWDKYMIEMANKSLHGMNLAPAPYIPHPMRARSRPGGFNCTSPSDSVDNGPEIGA